MKIDKPQEKTSSQLLVEEREIALEISKMPKVSHSSEIKLRVDNDKFAGDQVVAGDTCCRCHCRRHAGKQPKEPSFNLDDILEKSEAQKAQEAAIIADQSSALLYQNRQVRVKTCADVYEHWRSYKRFYMRKAPKEGVEFQIDYLDTGAAMSEAQRASAPVVLALHGAPGSYKDFALLIQHLSGQQVRVIAPNFPEYTATVETGVLFRHSGDEKAAYLRDFLQAIKVSKIDLLVSHSSAIFPTLLILLNGDKSSVARGSGSGRSRSTSSSSSSSSDDQIDSDSDSEPPISKPDPSRSSPATSVKSTRDSRRRSSTLSKRQAKRLSRLDPAGIVKFCDFNIEIKAVALFNPAGHRMPKSMKPTWFKCGAVHCYQHHMGRYWFRKLGPAFLTVVGVPVKVDNMDNVMLSATVMRNSKCRRVKRQLELLSEKKIPTLLVFSENDKLIEKEIFYEMTQFMRLDEATFDTYDEAGQPELSRSQAARWCRVMVFKAGGHYAYSNYPKIVNQAVSELLAKTTSAKQQSIK